MNGIDYAAPLPPSVVTRCSTTAGLYGTCQGATATGLRLPETDDDGRVDQVSASLQWLSESMAISYAWWLAGNARPAKQVVGVLEEAGLVDGGE